MLPDDEAGITDEGEDIEALFDEDALFEGEASELEGPKEGECLVRLAATGVCHTDAYTLSGADPEGLFPSVLGHEGAGVVEEVGPGVRHLEMPLTAERVLRAIRAAE